MLATANRHHRDRGKPVELGFKLSEVLEHSGRHRHVQGDERRDCFPQFQDLHDSGGDCREEDSCTGVVTKLLKTRPIGDADGEADQEWEV